VENQKELKGNGVYGEKLSGYRRKSKEKKTTGI